MRGCPIAEPLSTLILLFSPKYVQHNCNGIDSSGQHENTISKLIGSYIVFIRIVVVQFPHRLIYITTHNLLAKHTLRT